MNYYIAVPGTWYVIGAIINSTNTNVSLSDTWGYHHHHRHHHH